MGMFNNFSKFTSKVLAKFKNIGHDKGKVHVPVTDNAPAFSKAKSPFNARKSKSYKRQPNIYYNFFRKMFKKYDKEGLLKPIKHFGNFKPVESFSFTKGGGTEKTVIKPRKIYRTNGLLRHVVHPKVAA